MRHFIVKYREKLCLNKNIVGNKAANLTKLVLMGFPGPPWSVLSGDGLIYSVREIKTRFGHSETSKDIALKNWRSFVSSIKFGDPLLPKKFWRELTKAFQYLMSFCQDPPLFAVRSSSPFEDLADRSYAGQYSTFLNVDGLEETWRAIKGCWLSVWDANVNVYKIRSDLNTSDHSMAVVVQRMIKAKVSGVLFTEDPVLCDGSIALLEASSGEHARVVDGQHEPMRFRIDKGTCKSFGGNLSEQYFHNELGENQIVEICKTGLDIESSWGNPQDIEWAYDQDQLWILQTRPLTTLSSDGSRKVDLCGRVWTNYFFVERFVDPVTPLGWSILGRYIERRALREPLFFLGCEKKYRAKKLTRLFDNHPHSRIDVFRQLYSIVPDFAISPDKKRAFFEKQRPVKWWIQLMRTAPYLLTRLVVKDANWLPPLHLRKWQRFLYRYQKGVLKSRNELSSFTSSKLKQFFLNAEDLTDELLSYHRWSITFADLFYHLLNWVLKRWLKSKNSHLCSDLLSGLSGNKTVEANADLSRIAIESFSSSAKVHANDEVNLSKQQIVKCTDSQNFKHALEKFLLKHGHRSKNLDPYYPTWQDDPDFLINIIESMSQNLESAESIMIGENRASQRRIKAEKMLDAEFQVKSIQNLIRRRFLIYILKLAQAFALLRENQRYYWHMTLADMRAISLEVGRRLCDAEVLSSAADIFFLEREEFLKCFGPIGALRSYRKITKKKKLEWIQSGSGEKNRSSANIGNMVSAPVFHGLGVSVGKVEGTARIVRSLEEAQQIPIGTVLVTGSVDPAWTPIFAKASGLVLEVGGILSHAAIVAREFGLPAVTSVSKATQLIPDGGLVRVDGERGTVQLVRDLCQH